MYLCALRGGTADCQMEQSAVFASLRSVQGAAPLARDVYKRQEDAEGRKTFSLQAIAEMLGMDSDTSWQHQMEDYRKKHELE